MKKLTQILTILTIVLATGQANAVLITFEGFNNTERAAPITRSGFDIGNVIGDIQHFHEITSTNFGLPNNGTGVLLNDRDSRIFVEETLGNTFMLTSVDVATALSNNPAMGITIEGFLNNISTGLVSLANLGNGYTALFGNSLGTVDRIVFDGTGLAGGFVLDNLDVNINNTGGGGPVPEPTTLVLIGLGLAGIGFTKKRGRASLSLRL